MRRKPRRGRRPQQRADEMELSRAAGALGTGGSGPASLGRSFRPLDVRPAAPMVAPTVAPSGPVDGVPVAAHDEEADDGGREPADGRQEAEGYVGLPRPTRGLSAQADARPVEDCAAVVADEFDDQTE